MDHADLTHGTTTGYRYGCRCDPCKAAKRAENAAGYSSPDKARSHNPRPRQRIPSVWRDENGKRIWTAADKERERARYALDPTKWRLARKRSRQALRDAAERGSAYRADLLAEARVQATGELAELIAEQDADDRSWFVWSVSLDAQDQECRGRDHVEWDDPTSAAVLDHYAA